MDLNVEEHLTAVTRTVTYTARDDRPASVVTLSRSFTASAEYLWDAVTNAERIPRWFMPVSGDLRLGGRYQLEGNAGGTIVTCEPPSLVAVTWEFAGDVSWVEVSIAEEGAGRARVTLSHTALLSPHWDEFGSGAVGVGWEMGLLGLALYLAQPDAPKLDEEEFITGSSGGSCVDCGQQRRMGASLDRGRGGHRRPRGLRRRARPRSTPARGDSLGSCRAGRRMPPTSIVMVHFKQGSDFRSVAGVLVAPGHFELRGDPVRLQEAQHHDDHAGQYHNYR